MLPPQREESVDIPLEILTPNLLAALIEAFVLREGSDYGETEIALDQKVREVRNQLERGELRIVFDLTSDTASIVPIKRHLS